MRHLFTILFVGIALSCVAQSITPVQARKSMGKEVTVCGPVTSAQFTTQVQGNPTYLGFGNLFPNQTFSVVIMEIDLGNFAYNPADLKGSDICVTGMVEMFAGKPAIIVKNPSQIEEQAEH